jgi:putative ABC transport system permease protein
MVGRCTAAFDSYPNIIVTIVKLQAYGVMAAVCVCLHTETADAIVISVVSYAVARRTKEIGLRLAFGATSGRVVLQIIRENLGVIIWGTAIGWVLALVISVRAIPKGAVDVPVFVAVSAILLSVATLACWLPARRASRIDPMAALRHE